MREGNNNAIRISQLRWNFLFLVISVILIQLLDYSLAQNTRTPASKYSLITTTTYVNKIPLVGTSLSLFYGITGGQVYFYFSGTSAALQLEIIFGTSKQNYYSVIFDHALNQVNDYFYTNGVAALVAAYTVKSCALAALAWDQTCVYNRLLTPAVAGTQFAITPNTPFDILLIDGATTYPYTITFYNTQQCSGTCNLSVTPSCDGPDMNDCLSCNDPLRVSIYNLCVPRLPSLLTGGTDQIWNKFQYSASNSSLYYGFRTEQSIDFCYFRIIVSQPTPTWIGLSFTTDHLNSAPATDMVVITYQASTPVVYDMKSTSATFNTLGGGSIPSLDGQQNYVVTQGGHDGSSKWDITIVRACDMSQLSIFDAASQAAYYDTTSDFQKIVSCTIAGVCTYASPAVNYNFGMVIGTLAWDSVILLNNHHTTTIIATPTYPATPIDLRLINEKYCPSCLNQQTSCIGPELQDCTACPVGQQFDPHYPSTGPGICIPIIIPCHPDCSTCTTSYSDGCTACADSSNTSGRCISSNAQFWNIVNISSANLKFYYGWNSSLEVIFFRFIGNIQGWLGLLFASSLAVGQDSILITKPASITVSDQFCATATTCFASPDPQQDVKLIGGSSITAAPSFFNVTVGRLANTQDANDATIINTFMGVSLYYHTTSQTVYVGAAVNFDFSISLPSQQFLTYQVCAVNCATCSGPETTDCVTCNAGYSLLSSSPSSCVLTIAAGCSGSCSSCQSGFTSTCITCVSQIEVIYKNTCVLKYPLLWNKISFIHSNFTVYYGFDSTNTNIYFRVTGKNLGWIGLSFMSYAMISSNKHYLTDMVILRKLNNQLLIEDRFSYDLAQPFLDTNLASGISDYQYIQGDRDSEGYWDVYFMRALSTTDSKDFSLTIGTQFELSFAMADTDVLIPHSAHYSQAVILSTSQICNSSCLTCSGPEVYECLSCNTGFYLSGSVPAYCLQTYLSQCNSNCSNCYGKTDSNCMTCSDSNYVQIDGVCVSKSPSFWNKLAIQATPSLFLYYGYDTLFQRIYFKIKGISTAGWIGLAFQSSQLNMDMVVLRYVSASLVIEDRYTALHNYRPWSDMGQGGFKNYVLISGSRTGSIWDATFMRKVNTNDPPFNSVLPVGQYDLSVAMGNTDAFEYHTITPIVLNSILFQSQQVCDVSCNTCIGPETSDCMTCLNNYQLLSTAPSTCVLSTYTCDLSCLTCSGPGSDECLSCSIPASKILYDKRCINSNPDVWNRIDVSSTFILYYGYHSGGRYIYFRAVGPASGWFGVGFNGSMVNTDMHIVRSVLGIPTVEDRYSYGHSTPLLDLQQNILSIICSITSNIDCKWVRYSISPDSTYDQDLQFDISMNIIFAFGSTSSFTQHSQTITLKNVLLSRSQICHSTCLTCNGPDPSNCLTLNNTGVSSTKVDYIIKDWSYSMQIQSSLILFLIIYIL